MTNSTRFLFLRKIRAISDFQFGPSITDILLDKKDSIQLICSKNTGKLKHIYEDGQQLRDFVHVSDVVHACNLAATDDKAKFQVFNVGSGHPISILQLARSMVKLFEPNGSEREVEVTGHYRVGDIRDCYADISKITSVLGSKPSVSLSQGLSEFLSWAASQSIVDRTQEAAAELTSAGLLRRGQRG